MQLTEYSPLVFRAEMRVYQSEREMPGEPEQRVLSGLQRGHTKTE